MKYVVGVFIIVFMITILGLINAQSEEPINLEIMAQDVPSTEDVKPDVPDGSDIEGYTPDSEMNPDLPKNPGKKWEVKGTPKVEVEAPKQ